MKGRDLHPDQHRRGAPAVLPGGPGARPQAYVASHDGGLLVRSYSDRMDRDSVIG